MLTWLRDSAKIFLIVTIVVFVSLIFLRWGMGASGGDDRNPYDRPIAIVNGTEVLPANYHTSIQEYNNNYRYMLENSGNPDPEAMLVLMSGKIGENAFEGMINSYLEQDYLETVDLPEFTFQQTEALILVNAAAQNPEGMTPEEYIEMFREENPGGYQQYFYGLFNLCNSLRFSIAAELVGMSSKAEVEFRVLREQGSITARYITFDIPAVMPTAQELKDFYENNINLFIEVPGTSIRYLTVQVQPAPADYLRASEAVDSLAYASSGVQRAGSREQFSRTFGSNLALEEGQRSIPVLGMSLGYPNFESFHVLRLDSTTASIPDSPVDTTAYLRDTLYVTHWERLILPGNRTVNNTLWTLERESETILANSVPQIADSLLVIGFGDMTINENTVTGGIVSEELIAFALDTIWRDSIGPVFFHPLSTAALQSFTIVRKLDEYEGKTISYEEAIQNGMLIQLSVGDARRNISLEAATAALDYIRRAGISLGAYADAESIQINTTRPFTALEIIGNSLQSPDAAGGILYSVEFAEQALGAPEFSVIGPFRTGDKYVLAEVLSRQLPPDNPTNTALIYASTQNTHILQSGEHIVEDLTMSGNVEDLREQWNEYATAVSDSISAEEEKLEQ